MAYGFRIATATGITQVDDTFKNLAFIAKGVLVLDQWGFPEQSFYAMSMYGTLNFSGRDTPVVAFQSDYPVAFRRIANNGGGSWTFEIAFAGWQTSPNPSDVPAPIAISWFLFDRPPPIASGYGIRIRDGGGNEVFNSEQKYFRPKLWGAIPAGVPSAYNQYYDIGGLPAGNYAVVPPVYRQLFNSIVSYADQSTSTYYISPIAWNDGVRNLPTGIRVGAVAVHASQPYMDSFDSSSPPLQSTSAGFAIAVDVSGY